MYRIRLFSAVCLCLFLRTHAQSLQNQEIQLRHLFSSLHTATNDSARVVANDSLITALHTTLNQPDSYNYPFDSLLFMGKIYSNDKLLRIYSWNFVSDEGDYCFSCFIQRKADNAVFPLMQQQASFLPDEQTILKPQNWYGALYYTAIPYISHNKTFYILLGWSHYSDAVNFKIIDVLGFDDKDEMLLGAHIFQKSNNLLSRVVIPYSALHSLALHYEEARRLIFYNHVSKLSESNSGEELLTPDESFSGYTLTNNNLWEYLDEVPLQAKEGDIVIPKVETESNPE